MRASRKTVQPLSLTMAGAVAAGGFIGGSTRALFMLATPYNDPYYTQGWEVHIPNLLGCLILGFMAVVAKQFWQRHPVWAALVMTGFFSSFTTFSALVSLYLPRGDKPMWLMAVQFFATILLSVLVVIVGAAVGQLFQVSKQRKVSEA